MRKIQSTCCTTIMVLVVLGAGCEGEEFIQGLPLPQHDEQRIVGGQTFSGLPAVGALAYNGQMHCTGTLIGPRMVLTAAHCVSGVYASGMRFMLGPSIYNAQASLQVSSVHSHPNFSFYNIQHDIGVAMLSQDAPVEPLGVVTYMDSSWVGTSLFFVGYGSTGGYGGGVGTKRAVWMPITQVDSTTFSYGGGGRNTCMGDSGGPAFYQDENGQVLVAGVTSHGDQYCNYYGVDTRVDRYLSWLGISGSSVTPQDNCSGETYEGRCSGNTLIWCENNQVKSVACGSYGKTCAYNPSNSLYDCMQ